MNTYPVEPRLTEYLHAKASHAGIPLSGTFELTPCCNMACKMCYVRMTKQQQEAIAPLRTAKEWLDLAAEAKEHGLLYLLVTGGEPFLRPDIQEILSGLHRLGLLVSVNSNGTMIDERVIAWLKQTPPCRVNVTLYGSSDDTYQRLCGNPQGYTQAVRGIRLLKEAGIAVKINCSVTPYNVDDIEGILAFAEEEGLMVQVAAYMFPPLRREPDMVGCNDRLTAEEAAYQSARIFCLQYGEDEYLRRIKEQDQLPLPSELGEDCPVLPSEGEGMRCRAGKCSFWVTWDGRMIPCGMLTTSGPNVFQEGFLPAWEIAKRTAASIRMAPKCSKCKLYDRCRPCAAMALTETGRFDLVPEYRCQMTMMYGSASKRLESQILERRRK